MHVDTNSLGRCVFKVIPDIVQMSLVKDAISGERSHDIWQVVVFDVCFYKSKIICIILLNFVYDEGISICLNLKQVFFVTEAPSR